MRKVSGEKELSSLISWLKGLRRPSPKRFVLNLFDYRGVIGRRVCCSALNGALVRGSTSHGDGRWTVELQRQIGAALGQMDFTTENFC